jgi:uncharacterized repeat protein (TIGR02543 family)
MKRRDSMNKKLLCVGAICSLVSLFTACEALGPEPAPVSYEKAVVGIQIRGGVQGRTVSPEISDAFLAEVTEWVLRGEKQGEQEIPLATFGSAIGETINIDPGDWNFTLNGYNEDSIKILTGKKTQTISLGGTQTLTFEVAPLEDGTGSGTVKLTINLPPESGITEARVFKDGVALETPIEPDLDNNRIVFTGTFSSGVYYFSVRLYKNTDLYGVVSEIVYVWPDMRSEETYDLTEDDLKFIYTITYHQWDGEITTGHYRRTDATTKLAAPASRPGYNFRGWYERAEDAAEDAVSGSAVPQISAGSTGNRAFYAKWIPATFSGYTLADALAMIANAEDGDAYTIVLNGPASIDPVILSYGGAVVSITLEGEGAEQKISLSSKGSLFTLEDGVTLKLGANITLQGRDDNNASLVKVNSGGELEMNAGSKISGNRYSGSGGGVSVSSGGSFTMKGGEISGNTSVGGSYNGGGVSVASNATFTMSDGAIKNNSAFRGGGVEVSGTFTMDKGAISDNTATQDGGGLIVYSSGTFTMNEGVISGNKASYGGAVYVANGTLIKPSGGVIYGSDASDGLKNIASGGTSVVFSSKKRDSTVEANEKLDTREGGAAGGWVDRWAVTFDADEGTPVTQPARVNNGASLGASMPPDPARDGCAFGGWYTEQNGGGTQFTAATTVSKAVTVYANWQYTVTFDFDDGTSVTETRAVNSGDPVDAAMPSDPTRDGYAFGGWYTAQNGGGTQFAADTPVTGNIRVYALWLP